LQHCGEAWGSARENFCIFKKTVTDVHLIAKPEKSDALKEACWNLAPEGKKLPVACRVCGSKVGSEVPFGPDNAKFVAFKTSGIRVGQLQFVERDRWSNIVKFGPDSSSCMLGLVVLDLRGMDNFLGNTFSSNHLQKRPPPLLPQVVFADPTNVNHFRVNDLNRSEKAPTNTQLEAYIEALLRDLIIVMPTGTGKTFVASLLLHRMTKLNRQRLAVFIVDRIPLVFQQATVIEDDTGLSVCRLCGENQNKLLVSKILDGAYNVLVVTAGCLLELLDREILFAQSFSVVVFDECHHVTGNHVYAKLLKHFISCELRIVGFSASPFSAKTVQSAFVELGKLRDQFRGAVILRPSSLSDATQEVSWVRAMRSREAEQFRTWLCEIVNRKACRVLENIQLGPDVSYQQLKGYVRASLETTRQDDPVRIKKAKSLLAVIGAIEIVDALGTNEARSYLEENGKGNLAANSKQIFPTESHKGCDGGGPYDALVKIISTSKPEQCLIFVATREVAKRLSRMLSEEFSQSYGMVQFIVGHGGSDGMGWNKEQKQILRKCRDGECRVLVSTSVLEEGLDVPTCDLVVRFNGRFSLIQFIQSRGRARSQLGKLVVIVKEDEDQRGAAMAQTEERNMILVLKSLAGSMGLPSETCRRLLLDEEALAEWSGESGVVSARGIKRRKG